VGQGEDCVVLALGYKGTGKKGNREECAHRKKNTKPESKQSSNCVETKGRQGVKPQTKERGVERNMATTGGKRMESLHRKGEFGASQTYKMQRAGESVVTRKYLIGKRIHLN